MAEPQTGDDLLALIEQIWAARIMEEQTEQDPQTEQQTVTEQQQAATEQEQTETGEWSYKQNDDEPTPSPGSDNWMTMSLARQQAAHQY
ncbi:hypothetical protein NEOLI_004299 [Neolecta irregularis DAH-3]|uniref:Uncharacterized protein n=1 Tax=Neolecta irregularis (strain DAH-3) TaxID=1198029 RepID=A0A1U7LUA9_NEOID|nr:hypothetical protein NEOLI_004299 [Neolecta irregularis DAH-3]|eukprot:OLL26209.1 hypothetical protein NEOLI_004299 [Neolecta irregularis DAH-3]